MQTHKPLSVVPNQGQHQQPIHPAPYSLEGQTREARRHYLQGLLSIGFSFLELHMLNASGGCSCPWYSTTRQASKAEKARCRALGIPVNACKNPGKHPVRLALKSLMTDVKSIEAHLDKGGSVGMVLRLNGLPTAPMRLVIFDCDRPGAKEWLEARGITSPLMVKGKRGWHFYALLPAGCPDLKSDTMTLNPGKDEPVTPEKPGIDIKVSGHVVIPFSPNKTIIFNGQDISADPEAAQRIFKDQASLAAVLPVIDPRILVPTMKEFIPEAPAAAGTLHIASKKRAKTKQIRLSKTKVHKDKIDSPLRGLAYHRRKDMAVEHVQRAAPGTGSRRGHAMLRVLYALSKHYWLSEVDRLDLVMKYFNLRLRDAEGACHPFRDGELRRMVRRSSGAAVVSPFGLYGDGKPYPFDVRVAIAKLKTKNLRSNKRRGRQRQQDAAIIHAEVHRFIHEVCVTTVDMNLRTRQAVLHEAYEGWTATQEIPASASPKRFGQILTALGFEKDWGGHNSDQYRLGIALVMAATG